jgi:hypothetical protein
MTKVFIPPPSPSEMLMEFAEWMARHAHAKVTVTYELSNTNKQTFECDYRIDHPGWQG